MDKYLSVAEQVFSGMRYRYENGEHVIDFGEIVPVDVKFIYRPYEGRLTFAGVSFGFSFCKEYYCEFSAEDGELATYYRPDDMYCGKPYITYICDDGEILDAVMNDIVDSFYIKEEGL